MDCLLINCEGTFRLKFGAVGEGGGGRQFVPSVYIISNYYACYRIGYLDEHARK